MKIHYTDRNKITGKREADVACSLRLFIESYAPGFQISHSVLRILDWQLRHGMTTGELEDFVKDSDIFFCEDRTCGNYSPFGGVKITKIELEK